MGRPIKTCLHFHHTFYKSVPPTHVLRSRYTNPTTRILISSLPKLLSTQIIFSPHPNLCKRVECWRDYHLKHKSKEFIINTPSITFWRVVPPILVRCQLGASVKMLSWTKKFVKARGLPTSWRSTRVRQVLHGWWPWWDRQGCFFADPSWVEPSLDSCNRYPSWVEVSTDVDVR